MTVCSSTCLINFPVSSSVHSSVYTSGGGGVGTGLESGESKRKFVSYDTALGRTPGMTTCTSCQQQVMTNVTYKPGMYAWLMCLLFICCGWVCALGRLSYLAWPPQPALGLQGKKMGFCWVPTDIIHISVTSKVKPETTQYRPKTKPHH